MKKNYIVPEMLAVRLHGEQMLAASGINGNNGIGYGGIDNDGELDPEVKGNAFGDTLFDE